MESFEFASLPRMSAGQLLTSYFLKAEEKKTIKFHLQLVSTAKPCMVCMYMFVPCLQFLHFSRLRRANSPTCKLANVRTRLRRV